MEVDRRVFLQRTGGVALAVAALPRSVSAQSVAVPPSTPVRMVRTPILDIGYHESGPANGLPVIMLHGFPDDAHAYDGVAPLVAKAGYRALSVYLRGYGPTRLLDETAPKTAQQAAIAQDVMDFADALGLPPFVVAGFDWGGRAAGIVAALHPDRVKAAVLMGGYSIQNTISRPAGAPNPQAVRRGWYQWYFNTETGRIGLERGRAALCELMWREWSPTWTFSPELYAQTAASFDNPDFVGCVIHSYRHRNFNAEGEARFADVEKRLAARPPVTVPTIVLHGGDDAFGVPPAAISAGERATFPNLVDKRIVPGAGHFIPHEKPEPVARAIIDVIEKS